VNVYIAYGTAADQVTALRLQALAAVNGLTVYVPPAHTRRSSEGTEAPLQSESKLIESDVVLGVVTVGVSDTCWRELNAGKRLGKTMVVMTPPTLMTQLESHFPGCIVVIDEADPGRSELELVRFLKKADMQQQSKKAVMALSTIALGLLLLSAHE